MDQILARETLLPPGTECRPLDHGSYALTIPGHVEPARITTSPDIFDNFFESHQLLLPDAPLFRTMNGERIELTDEEDKRLDEIRFENLLLE